jgi:hypothetical protein
LSGIWTHISIVSKVRHNHSIFSFAIGIPKRSLGKGALIRKKDNKSAFRLFPIYPGDFDILGFEIGSNYYIDKCLPMGCSISCLAEFHFQPFLMRSEDFLEPISNFLFQLATLDHDN